MEVATKEKKTRTPRSGDSIIKGALAMPLEDKVRLRNELDAAIKDEVEGLKVKAELAASIANGVK